METLTTFFAALLLGVSGLALWTAYRIKYEGRNDLIQIGTGPLRGAESLSEEFALVALVQGLGYFLLAALLLVFHSSALVWLSLPVAGIALVYKQMLVKRVLRSRTDTPASEA
jgi:hypothetical protein